MRGGYLTGLNRVLRVRRLAAMAARLRTFVWNKYCVTCPHIDWHMSLFQKQILLPAEVIWGAKEANEDKDIQGWDDQDKRWSDENQNAKFLLQSFSPQTAIMANPHNWSFVMQASSIFGKVNQNWQNLKASKILLSSHYRVSIGVLASEQLEIWDSVGNTSCCIDNFSDQFDTVQLYTPPPTPLSLLPSVWTPWDLAVLTLVRVFPSHRTGFWFCTVELAWSSSERNSAHHWANSLWEKGPFVGSY